MNEPAAKYEAETTPEALACPFCGCKELFSNEWQVGDEHAEKLGADEFGEVWAWECKECLGSAPMASWNKRADPWRYPPDVPEEGQRVLHTYRGDDGRESMPITAVYSAKQREYCHPIVRWMAVPGAGE